MRIHKSKSIRKEWGGMGNRVMEKLGLVLDNILLICHSGEKAKLSPETALILYGIEEVTRTFKDGGFGLNLVSAIGDKSPESYLRLAIDKIEQITEIEFAEQQRALLNLELGKAYYLLGDLNDATERFYLSLEQAENLGLIKVKAEVLKQLGDVACRRNHYEAADNFYRASLAHYEKTNDEEGQAEICSDLSIIAFNKGEWNKVEEAVGKCLEIAAETKNARLLAKGNNTLGGFFSVQGRYEEADSCFQKATEAFQRLGDDTGLAEVYNNKGHCLTLQGRWRDAGVYYEKSIHHSTKADNLYQTASTYLLRAELCIQISNWKAAKSYSNHALDYFLKIGSIEGMAKGYRLLGIMNRELGYFTIARTYLEKSLKTWKDIGNKYYEAKTNIEIAQLAQKESNAEEAAEKFNQAIEIFACIGAKNEIKKTEVLIGSTEEKIEFAF
jgi:tetratricopeptide (TPR) repeat protein